MRHKNKKSLKNLKQFRVRSKFVFYVLFRPIAQKWFFPVMTLILLGGILHYEYREKWSDERWTFTNETISSVPAEALVGEEPLQSTSIAERNRAHPEGGVVKTKDEGGAGSPVAPQVEVIKKVAEKEGIDWKILYGICKKESNCNGDRVGDSGNSYGYFQIHQKYHPGTIKCAKDLKCAAEWTAKRLKRHAHLGEYEMLRSHNGLVANNANAYYVEDIYQIIKSL